MTNINDLLHFWNSVMWDLAEIMYIRFSPKETEYIANAVYFKEEFAKFQEKANGQITDELINNNMTLLISFINFKKHILHELISYRVAVSLTPSLINHMINEDLEFYYDIQKIKNKVVLNPVEENIHLHQIWLLDAAGHAAVLAASFDPFETFMITESTRYINDFNILLAKAVELGTILNRTNLSNSILDYLNEQVAAKITEFIYFLNNIKDKVKHGQVLSVMTLLIPEHMIREEHYYLNHIQRFIQNKK